MGNTYNGDLSDLAANAFIEVLELGVRSLTYQLLEWYGEEARKKLKENCDNIRLFFGRYYTDEFYWRYEKFFKQSEDGKSIELNGGITKSQLIEEFRGYLPLDMLIAFIRAGEALRQKYLSELKEAATEIGTVTDIEG